MQRQQKLEKEKCKDIQQVGPAAIAQESLLECHQGGSQPGVIEKLIAEGRHHDIKLHFLGPSR